LGLDVEVAARAVGLMAARGVEERHEDRIAVSAIDDVCCQPSRLATELERERAGTVRRLQLVVRGRDLERGRLVAGVRRERQALEPKRLVDREVGESREVVAD